MKATLNRELAWRTIILAILLSWPLILFGRPSYIADSVSYLKGGKVAVEFATAKVLQHVAPAPAETTRPETNASNTPVSARLNDVPKAARSVLYSVSAYLLRWPGTDMTALALVQIVAAAFIGAVVTIASGVTTRRRFLLVGVALAFATPLAPFSALAVPDVLAGFVIANFILIVTAYDRLSVGVLLLVASIISFAVTAHASIPPLAAGMILVGAGVLLMRTRFDLHYSRSVWAWLLVPTFLGFAASAAVGFVAFGEVSVAAKRFPLSLARSVADGPARWYLERHCVTARYAVCEVFGTRFPRTINSFLFDKTGLNGRATPEQMDRIRAEESEIVIRAAFEYPGVESYNLSRKITRQLVSFDLKNTQYQERIALDAAGTPQLVPSIQGGRWVVAIVELLTKIALALSVVWAIWSFKRLERRERVTVLLVAAGLVGNAIICVVFSALADRYQARVVWVLPLFILSMAAARYRRTGNGAIPSVDVHR